MRDVAALAGVSLKTVSRVVNGEAGVSPALVDRVEEASRRLDFRPNLGARSLRRADGRTGTVGLVLDDVANPFSAAVHRAVEDAAHARGVAVLAGSLDGAAQRERELVRAFTARRVDGLLVMPSGGDGDHLLLERRSGTALVFVDRGAADVDADVVVSDNRAGALAGVRHLLAAGHRRIAFLGDRTRLSTARERHAGYRDALAARPAVPASLSVHDLDTPEAAYEAVQALLHGTDPPTALFTAQNLITMGALRALRQLDRQHSVALVGFDDVPLADLLDPAVTVVAQDPGEIGRRAAVRLFRRIDGDRGPWVRDVVPTRLLPRGSGEIPPR